MWMRWTTYFINHVVKQLTGAQFEKIDILEQHKRLQFYVTKYTKLN